MTTRTPASSGAAKQYSGPRHLRLETRRQSRNCPFSPFGWAARTATRLCAPRFSPIFLPPARANRPPREHRANRRPVTRRRPGARLREGRRPLTRLTPRPPTTDFARQPRRPDDDPARWGFVPPDSWRADRTLPEPTRRRTQPVAGPSQLDNSKGTGRHTGDETPALSCQLTARISCVAGEPRPIRPTASS